MPTPQQITRLANVAAWIRTAKEALPAINHGPNAVAAEQIARASALLDRMHRCVVAVAASADESVSPTPVATRAGRAA